MVKFFRAVNIFIFVTGCKLRGKKAEAEAEAKAKAKKG
jgi:hypothetical protein